MQQTYRQAVRAFIKELSNTIDEHRVFFQRQNVDYTELPKLLKVTEERNIEPPIVGLALSWKIETSMTSLESTRKRIITSYCTITVAGEERDAKMPDLLRALAKEDTKIQLSGRQEVEGVHYMTGESFLKINK